MKKILALFLFLGMFMAVATPSEASSLQGKAQAQVVQQHHGGHGGGHGGPAMHHGGGGHRPPMVGHHPAPRHPHHRGMISVGVPRRVYVGGRYVSPYYYDCFDPLGFYDPYYCGMYAPRYYAPGVNVVMPSVGFSVAF